MGPQLAVEVADLVALARPATTGAPQRSVLQRFLRSDRIVRLLALAGTVGAEGSEHAPPRGYGEAMAVLRGLGALRLGAIVDLPSFGAWLAVAEDLVDRGSHQRFAGGHLENHLGRLAGLVLGDLGSEPVHLRLGAEPVLCLGPATTLLCLPPDAAGQEAEVVEQDGVLHVVRADGDTSVHRATGAVDGVGELRALRAIGGIVLDDTSPWRTHGAGAAVALGELGEADLDRWCGRLREAIDLLDAVAPALAVDVASTVSIVVPLSDPGGGTVINHTSASMFGLVATSLPATPAALAEVLVHEAQHSKLHLIERLVPLVGPDQRADRYSPWRPDARPAAGVLHGAYSFAAVADWYAALADAGPVELRDDAAAEALRRRDQVADACAVLVGSGRLSDRGRALVGQLERQAAELAHLDGLVDRPTRARADGARARHREAWDLAHVGIGPQHGADPDHLARAWRTAAGEQVVRPEQDLLGEEDRQVLAQLGARPSAAGNHVGTARIRMDATAHLLGRLSVEDPPRFQAIGEQVLGLPDGPFVPVLRGHVAYVGRRFDEAFPEYLEAVRRMPYDIDRWADLAFCLRHLGRAEDAAEVLRNLDALAALAPTAAVGGPWGGHLGLEGPVEVARWVGADGSVAVA